MSTENPMSHILIFEPDPRGHTFEWLAYLLRYSANKISSQRVTFAVAPTLADQLAALPDVKRSPLVQIVALDETESRFCLSDSLAVSGFARWWTMRRHLKRSGADHGHFLCLDHLSLPLALGLRARASSLSGILFRPSTHYVALTNIAPNRNEVLRDLRKQILYRLMLRNPALRRVLSLDPYFVQLKNRFGDKSEKIEALADPAFPMGHCDGAPQNEPSPARMHFLLFGALTKRKGILVLYDALMRLPPDIAQQCAVTVAGKIDPSLNPTLKARLTKLVREQPRLWIDQQDRFVPEHELNALIRRSDVILAPYQRFVGSSGAMLRAASAQKPVLTQDCGLLGKLTQDFALGMTADTSDPDRLAAAITTLVRDGMGELFNPASAMAFIAAHSPDDFAAAIFCCSSWETVRRKRRRGNFNSASRTGHASPLS